MNALVQKIEIEVVDEALKDRLEGPLSALVNGQLDRKGPCSGVL